jgi:hypothetical protein
MNQRRLLTIVVGPTKVGFEGGFGLCPHTKANGEFQRKQTFSRAPRNDLSWVDC